MNPYLDIAGFKLRTLVRPEDVDIVEKNYPGFVGARFAMRSSELNAAARKRYGNAKNIGYHVPFGQIAPALVPSGVLPPGLTLIGRPVVGCLRVWVQILVGGAVGTATFAWSPDGGVTWFPTDKAGNASNPTALLAGAGPGSLSGLTPIPLDSTGLALQFGNTTQVFSPTNAYKADTPVPEAVLCWLVDVTSFDVMMKRGANAADPAIVNLEKTKMEALARIKEASDGKDGLLDLPISEDMDSAVTTGGVLSHSEQSPYEWTDREERRGRNEDTREAFES